MPFDSFLGNRKAVAFVRDMLAAERVPHALLFSGLDGVGKKTLALMLAKALNCEQRTDDFCGECSRCRKVEEMLARTREDLERRREMKDAARRVEGMIYFDVQLIAPLTRYILIEQVRQLRNLAYTRPFELPRRVFIVDQAQAVHWQAIDLLLKVLEEPPETTTLILICPNASEIRSTLRSRCQRIQFAPAPEAIVHQVLAEDDRVPKAQRALVARLASGSISKARSFDFQHFQGQRRPWLDFLDGVALAGRGAGTAVPDWKLLFDSTKALTENREAFEDTLRIGYSLLSDLLQMLLAEGDSRVVNLDLAQRLKTWASRLGLRGIEMLKNGLDQAHRSQIRNVNQQLGLEALAIELRSVVGRP